MDDSDIFPVTIIGGGIAGLTAAAHLAERGIPPLVLEADQLYAGGRLSGGDPETFEYGGQTWSFPTEHGIHALWGGYGNMRATLERFTNTQVRASDGEEWINRWRRAVRRVEAGTAVRSRWLPAPFHYLQLLFRPRFWSTITPLDFLSLPGFLASLLWTVGYDPIMEESALDGLMMHEYFRGWTPNLRATFIGLGKNLLAAPEDSISVTAFIAALRFFTMLRRDTWHPYYFPANSNTALICPLIDAIEQRGGKIQYGATALGLQRSGDCWRVSVEDQAVGGRRAVVTENVILALDAPAAQRLLYATGTTSPEARRLRFPGSVRTTTARLWFDREPTHGSTGGMFTGDFAFDNFFWLHKMQDEFRRWNAQTGGSAVELHLYGSDAQNNEPDKLILIRAVDELQRAFPELRGHYVHGAVRRNSKSHTQFRVPTAASLHVNTPWEHLYACGDWIGYPTPSLWMERSCTTAIAAANMIIAARGGDPFPLVEPPKPEALARGLQALVKGGRRLLSPPLRAANRRLRGRKRSSEG
ncbi:MAG TPA: FAD-dependent oxidoreductase [Phototrophicaceae bacterium]|nr:FAD-dependent oxidoreductase [Phototrophicaceae bacterium]